ncbi:MAG: 30S ribosomal protein S17 [bacterium]
MKAITASVISTKMNKTAVVVVTSAWSHPLYQKIIRRSKKFLVHDELGAKVGDTVTLKEVRPISKNKHLIITEILKK